jgi:hypothetical protein
MSYRNRELHVNKLGFAPWLFAAGLVGWPVAAQQKPPAQPAATAPDTKKAQPVTKAPDAKKAQPAQKPPVVARKGPPKGPIERYDCKIGTEDNHARIALLAQGGEVQSVAYYSKWKPRTCSVHLQRGDAYSNWKDTGDATTITTEFGDFLIQTSRSEYQLFFREVDRMHYCGMLGKLNGSMTVTRGPRRKCSVEGTMDRNEPEALDVEKKPDPALEQKVEPQSEKRAESPAK